MPVPRRRPTPSCGRPAILPLSPPPLQILGISRPNCLLLMQYFLVTLKATSPVPATAGLGQHLSNTTQLLSQRGQRARQPARLPAVALATDATLFASATRPATGATREAQHTPPECKLPRWRRHPSPRRGRAGDEVCPQHCASEQHAKPPHRRTHKVPEVPVPSPSVVALPEMPVPSPSVSIARLSLPLSPRAALARPLSPPPA